MSLAQNTSNPLLSGNTVNPVMSGNTVAQPRETPVSPALPEVPLFTRIDAPQILFLAAAGLFIVGIAYFF